tara:strand:+ start:280 stop:1500 length:1221 start_codon:yes stop_codon:yes gene_type:complete
MILKILNAKSKKAIGLLALLASLGSFIADVLQPLAPFSKYIFFLAIFLLIIFRLLNFYKKGIYEKFSFIIIFFWLIAIMSGAVYLTKQNSFKKNGLFATLFPSIQEAQSGLGIIEKDLTDIKTTTEEIKEETKDITKKLEDIEQKIEGVNIEENIKKIDYTLLIGNEGNMNINLQPIETVREFFYSTDGKNYISLGFSETIDTRTGLNTPINQISFQEYKFVKRTFYVKYLDFNNNPKGPFKIEFDLKDEFLKDQKKWIKRYAKWVNWDLRKEYYGYDLWGILTYRCAIKTMKIKIDQEKVNTINFPSCEKELNEMKKNSYREHNIKELILLENVRFGKQVSSWNAIPVPNTKYIVFSHSETEYEEAIKNDYPYIYHPEIKNIKMQIIYYDDESSIFRSFDNPKLN